MMTGLPLGTTGLDLGELLVGTVTVTPVFFESNESSPNTEDWTAEEIQESLQDIREGVQWWSDRLAETTDKHSLSFVVDDTFAVDPFETSFEPIANTSDTFSRYVSQFLVHHDYADHTLNRSVQLFNDAQREANGTDWAFTIFMVDASNDEDGFFEPGVGSFLGAFAYNYGSFVVTTNDRPVSTITHEVGHVFQTLDEYPLGGDWTARSGYYDTQNLNAANNPTTGFVQQESIMRGGTAAMNAYRDFQISDSARSMLGWQDSDGDGVFDAFDVPLHLEGVGYFDSIADEYKFSGVASAVPLLNRNPFIRSINSDITLNRISEIQFRIDGGEWQTAVAPDLQTTDFDVSIPVSSDLQSIEFRAIDLPTGVTSPIVSGSLAEHAFHDNGVRGFAFLDLNQNGLRDPNDELIANAQVQLRNSDGSELISGTIRASDFADGAIPQTIDQVVLSTEGSQIATSVHSGESANAGGQRVFLAENITDIGEPFIERWDETAKLRVDFNEPVGQVQASVIGLNVGSHARIEAYDAADNLLTRTTTAYLPAGETGSVQVSDPQGRISSVRIFGQGSTSLGEFSYGVAVTEISYGVNTSVVTGVDGAFQIPNLANGIYQLEVVSDNVTQQFQRANFDVRVVDQGSTLIAAGAAKVNSPLFNESFAEDVDENGEVTPFDALLVINDMSANQPRVLGESEVLGASIDVNNDGSITPFDALLVINFLASQSEQPEGLGEQIAAALGTRDQTFSNRFNSDNLATSSRLMGNSSLGQTRRFDSSLMFDSTANRTLGESFGHSSSDRAFDDTSPDNRQPTKTPSKPEFLDSLLEKNRSTDLAISELIGPFDSIFTEPSG